MNALRPAIRLSVALVTHNRPRSLERALVSLREQDVQPWEVIISDDSDESSALAIRELARSYGCRYVRGPARGLYANRNHSALACGGTHIRTMDDDHELPPGHIDRCVEGISEDPGAVWIISEETPSRPRSDVCPPQLHPRGFAAPPKPGQACWAIADGATIYPREVFDRGLRFVEDFPSGAAFLEWGSRLHWLGYRIRHLNATYVFHRAEVSSELIFTAEADRTSRFFAMLSHSFLYQPTVRNKLLTSAELARQVVQNGHAGWSSLRRAHSIYRRHRASLATLRSGERAEAREPRARHPA